MSLPALHTSLWETAKCDLKRLSPDDLFQMWFEPLRCLETTEAAVTLGVPNDFAAIWIHDNYLDLISQRLRLAAGRTVHVTLKKMDQGPAGAGPSGAPIPEPKGRPTAKRPLRYDERMAAASSLNPRNTFENF